jgi:hypothetical protein
MIGAGVPSGATRTCQPVAENPGIVSATVGNIGFSAVNPIGTKSRGSMIGKFGAVDFKATKVESAA